LKTIDELSYEEMAKEAIKQGKFPELLIVTLSGNNFTITSSTERTIAERAFRRIWRQHLKMVKEG